MSNRSALARVSRVELLHSHSAALHTHKKRVKPCSYGPDLERSLKHAHESQTLFSCSKSVMIIMLHIFLL